MQTPLQRETRAYVQLKEWLEKEYAAVDETEKGLFRDTLEGETNLHEMLVNMARQARYREAMAEAVGSIIIENKERAARHERAAESIRRAIARAMEDADLPRVKAPDVSIWRREAKPKNRIVNEDLIPEQFWRQKMVRVLDKEAVYEAVAAGRTVPGVELDNGTASITITRK